MWLFSLLLIKIAPVWYHTTTTVTNTQIMRNLNEIMVEVRLQHHVSEWRQAFIKGCNTLVDSQKHEIERCSFTNDFCFKVDDIRDIQNMLNLCLTNPHINYSGIAEPVTNKGLLNALAECKNYNYDIFKKFK